MGIDLDVEHPFHTDIGYCEGRADGIATTAGIAVAEARLALARRHGCDEALVWAAKSDRVEVLGLIVHLGARVDADPYRGTPLVWAAVKGRTASIRQLVELGADPNQGGTFGGPDHREGVTALHLAAQGGRREAVELLLELGADPTMRDALHNGTSAGWAEFGGHHELAALLR